jgi:hypothetical protein
MIDKLRRFLKKPLRDKWRALWSSVHYMAASKDARARADFRGAMNGSMAPPAVLRGNERLYVACRPDWDVIYGVHPDLAALSENWIANNPDNAADLPRLYSLMLNVQKVLEEGTPGDLAELGVYRGNSAALLAHCARVHQRQLYLFDTFEGFDRRDLVGRDADKAGDFVDTSLELVQRNVGMQAVHWVQGYFPASIPAELEASSYCVVHLDCDLYIPTKSGLEFFFPRLSAGGLLILHDYSNPYWPGIRQAVDEFVGASGQVLILLPDKSGTAMIRKSRSVI